MNAGGLRWLERLNLRDNSLRDTGLSLLVDAWRNGACPGLRELDLQETDIGEHAVVRLARSLYAGGLSQLEVLNLSLNFGVGDESAVELAAALEDGAARNLRVLGLRDCRVGVTARARLRMAILTGDCPKMFPAGLELGDKVFPTLGPAYRKL
jgi:Ran GTPase-activating protein (RanGAP) involved in mRNA processing and transport